MGVQSAGGVRGVPISVGSGKAWLMRVRVGQEITVLQSKSGQGSLGSREERLSGVMVSHSEAHPKGALQVRDHSRSGDLGPHGDHSPRPCAPSGSPSVLSPCTSDSPGCLVPSSPCSRAWSTVKA